MGDETFLAVVRNYCNKVDELLLTSSFASITPEIKEIADFYQAIESITQSSESITSAGGFSSKEFEKYTSAVIGAIMADIVSQFPMPKMPLEYMQSRIIRAVLFSVLLYVQLKEENDFRKLIETVK